MYNLNKTKEQSLLTYGKHELRLEILVDHHMLTDPDAEDNVLLSAELDGNDIMNRLSGDPSDHGTDDRDYWGEMLIDLGLITEDEYDIDYVIPEFLRRKAGKFKAVFLAGFRAGFRAGEKAESEKRTEKESRLNVGRDYLMSVSPSKLTVEDCLDAFGFGRNGLKE